MYSGVPQAVLQMDPATSSLEYPKSQILTTGRSPRPCSSTLSSCKDTEVTLSTLCSGFWISQCTGWQLRCSERSHEAMWGTLMSRLAMPILWQ
jgi:hypothetical protein